MGNMPGFLNTNSKGVFVGAGYGDNESRKRSNNGKKGGHNPRFELESDMDRACGKRDNAIEDAANAFAKYAMAMNKNGDSLKYNSFDVLVSFSDADKVKILSKVIEKLVDNM